MSCINTAKSIVASLMGIYGNNKELSSIVNELNSIATEVTEEEKQKAKERLEEINKKSERTGGSGNTVDDTNKVRPIFDTLPFYQEGQRTMTYAGIGSRGTPTEILELMTKESVLLDSLGYKLQTGYKRKIGNRVEEEGADKAFSVGTTNKELFGPDMANEKTKKIAYEIHPSLEGMWKSVYDKWVGKVGEIKAKTYADGAVNLQARNAFQVFGRNLDTPVDFVLFYAKEGKGIRPDGGTGQAVEMARRKGIPTINMADPNWETQLNEILNKGSKPSSTAPGVHTGGSSNDSAVKEDLSGVYKYTRDNKEHTLEFTRSAGGTYEVILDGKKVNSRSQHEVYTIINDRGAVKQNGNTGKSSATQGELGGVVTLNGVGADKLHSLIVQNEAITEEESKRFSSEVDAMIKDENIDKHSNGAGHVAIGFGPVDYSYKSGKSTITHAKKSMPRWLQELGERAAQVAGKDSGYFNSVLINKFTATSKNLGRGIGNHSDREGIYVGKNNEVGAVAVFSIGGTTENHVFGAPWSREENGKGFNPNLVQGLQDNVVSPAGVVTTRVNDRSLNIMSSGDLMHYVGASNGTRYSLTFRHVPSSNIPAVDPGVEVSSEVLSFVQGSFGGKSVETVNGVQAELSKISLSDILEAINNDDNPCPI